MDDEPGFIAEAVADGAAGSSAIPRQRNRAAIVYAMACLISKPSRWPTASTRPTLMREHPQAAGFLLDGHARGEQGGSGKTFDWSHVPALPFDEPVLLAGGLTAHNVVAAIRAVRPYAVDVSSGIESAPGIKDAEKMRRFVAAVQEHCGESDMLANKPKDVSTAAAIDYTQYPDAHGRFGDYGGIYVAETLMAPLAELTAAYLRLRQRSGVHRRTRSRSEALRRPAESDLSRRAPVEEGRRRADPAQARRPEPHRRAQDQQHRRPGARRAAHGQAPHHRRDRRRPARRRQRDRGRAARARMRRLHGRGRHRAPGDQRLPHEAARRARSCR